MKRAMVGVVAAFGGTVMVLLAGVVGINAIRERRRTCACLDDCWCKTPAGRHLRWWIRGRYHKLPPPSDMGMNPTTPPAGA